MTRLDTPSIAPLSERWRSGTARLILIYGGFFLAWSVLLVALINWQISSYLEHIVDDILEQRVAYLSGVEREQLPAALAMTAATDRRGVMSFGVFDAAGRYVAGNIDRLPPELPVDGALHRLANGIVRIDGVHTGASRGVAVRIADGSSIVLTRTTDAADRVGAIIRNGFIWALSLTLIPGLLGGFLLARGSLKRVRDIETAVAPIMRGDLGVRLPISERRDEVDMLANIVNRMLDRLETLLGEVKGVSDSIAHDLRTPLTRLRAQLYRLQREIPPDDTHAATIERCITDTDNLLNRFRALLRISELEDIGRRAGFGSVDLGETLRRVHELYAPLAEEREIAFALDAHAVPALRADGHLLFEALANLVENAIKFTPGGGHVLLRTTSEEGRVVIDVLDDGRGIPVEDRDAVLRRFYRSAGAAGTAGHGLGLPLVAAIARLHGYEFSIGDNPPHGTRMRLWC